MRRRSRHTSTNGEPPEWPVSDACTQSDAALNEGLRGLAGLLARQAARGIFERECARDRIGLTPDAASENRDKDLP
jgi:hypothetical protein